MNIEDFHELLLDVRASISSINLIQRLTEVQNTIANMVNSPTDANHQQVFHNKLAELLESFKAYPLMLVDELTESYLTEYRFDDLIGSRLKPRITKTVYENGITPATLANNWKRLVNSVTTQVGTIDDLISAHTKLGIEGRSVRGGRAEISFSIPRGTVDEDPKKFGKEVIELEKLFGVYQELAVGSRPSLRLRSISCSEYTITIESAVAVITLISIALERAFAIISKFQDIKKKAKELEILGVGAEALKGVLDDYKNTKEKDIDLAVGDVMKLAVTTPDKGRDKEIKTELSKSIENLIVRLESGYAVSVRAGEIENANPVEGEELPRDVEHQLEMIHKIREIAPRLRERQVKYDGQDLIEDHRGEG